ncbi:MAG TPA: hypothetical protein VMA35_00990 [Candidatus Sulfopaludibacter sp.]|nr:hypothetical protein [Candidatus Sulfopaludibacter sp.]
MNLDDAKNLLLLYRPGTADAADPQMADALTLVTQDAELARWFGEHCARQEALRARFREIPVPAGLKEQIVSEHAALTKMAARRRNVLVGVLAVAAIVVSLLVVSRSLVPRATNSNTLASYQNQMIAIATSGYGMAYTTNDLTQIRDFLARHRAPADYTLPPSLEKTAATGCAIENWGNGMVSMICFRTGKPLPPTQPGDLWLFVVDRATVKGAPTTPSPQFIQVSQIITAVWAQGDELYMLGTEGDRQTIQKYL